MPVNINHYITVQLIPVEVAWKKELLQLLIITQKLKEKNCILSICV